MKKKYVAYIGQAFTLEWYFSAAGKSCALEYFQNLPAGRQNKILHCFMLLGEVGKIHNKEKFCYEGDQIFAIKASEDRFLCFFFLESKIIITNAYQKQSMKMPQGEKQRSLRSKTDYIKRCKEGRYYD